MTNPQIFNNIIEILEFRAKVQGDKIAYTYLQGPGWEEKNITYCELLSSAKKIAIHLLTKCNPKDRVLLLYDNPFDFIQAFTGCILAGITAVPYYFSNSVKSIDKIRKIKDDSGFSLILTCKEVAKKRSLIKFCDNYNLEKIVTTDIDVTDIEVSFPNITPDSIVFLQYTSGSTNDPKGVMVQHSNVMHNEFLIQKAFNTSESSIVVSWLPYYHDMGLIGNILQPLYTGFRCVLMRPITFINDPLFWLQTISKYNATISGAPNFAYDLCCDSFDESQIEELDLTSWQVAFNGAEPIYPDTLRRFYDVFQAYGFSERAFLPCYGMAESTLLISSVEHFEKPRYLNLHKHKLINETPTYTYYSQNFEVVCCGKPKGGELLIVGSNGNPVPEDTVGEIWIRSDSVAKGYWNNPELTERMFSSSLSNGETGYFRTGDVGFLNKGELFLLGRIKDIIIVHGQNYYTIDFVNTLTLNCEEIASSRKIVFSKNEKGNEQIIVISEIEKRGTGFYEKAVNNVIQNFFSVYELIPNEVILIRKGTMPVTSSGKVQSNKSIENYRNGKLIELHRWTQHNPNFIQKLQQGFQQREVEIRLLELIEKTTKIKVTPDTYILSAGLNSILITRLSAEILYEFNVKITYDYFYRNPQIKELVDYLEKNFHKLTTDTQYIKAIEVEDLLASPLQYSIWLKQELCPKYTYYNLPALIKCDDKHSSQTITKGFELLVKKYDILRTSFRYKDQSKLTRHIHDFSDFRLDCARINVKNKDELKLYLKQKSNTAFKLDTFPLFTTYLFEMDNGEKYFFLLIHHILVDGYSLKIIQEGLTEACERVLKTKDSQRLFLKSTEYDRYVSEERGLIQDSQSLDSVNYWKNKIRHLSPILNLPFDKGVDQMEAHTGATQIINFSLQENEAINKYLAESEISVFQLFLGSYFILQYNLTGQKDIVVNVPNSTRRYKEHFDIVGLCLNVLFLRCTIDENRSLKAFFNDIITETNETFKHSYYPTNLIYDEINKPSLEAVLSSNQIGFNALNFIEQDSGSDIFNQYQANLGIDLNYIFNCYILEERNGFNIRFDFRKEYFNIKTIDTITSWYKKIIIGAVENPGKSLRDILPTVKGDTNKILPRKSFKYFKYSETDRSIIERFEEMVDRFASNIAVKGKGFQYTYKELNRTANRIGRVLNKGIVDRYSKDFVSQHTVGIIFNEGIDNVLSILAVLKTSNVYVPIDAELPLERIKYILFDANIDIILYNGDNVKLLKSILGNDNHKICINIDEIDPTEDESNLGLPVDGKGIAYILYTSGSSGFPKGVVQSQSYIAQITHSFTNSLKISSEDCITLLPSFAFSASVMDLFGALLNGATLYLIDIKRNGFLYLQQVLSQENITIYHSVPSLLRNLIEHVDEGTRFEHLRLIYLAGEPLRKDDIEKIYAFTNQDCIIVNGLGCTEYNICRQYFINREVKVSRNNVPVGYYAYGCNVSLINDSGAIVKGTGTGEIVIRSKHLAIGYLNSVELTNSKFETASLGYREYHTGDIGQLSLNGCLIYLGRKDELVKLRGQRIELPEIEGIILRNKDVINASVALKKIAQSEFLCAYLIVNDYYDEDALKGEIKKFLPSYMIPSYFVLLEEFPYTSTGKVNKKELPIPEMKTNEKKLEFKNKVEKELYDIWKSQLEEKKFGTTDNYFEIGGDSLALVRIVSQIKKKFNVAVSFQELYIYSSVRTLSEYIQSTYDIKVSGPAIPYAEKKEYYPLSPVQKGVYIHCLRNPESLAYNLSYVLKSETAFEIQNLEKAFKRLIESNTVFRLGFKSVQGEPRCFIQEKVTFCFDRLIFNGTIENTIRTYVKSFQLDQAPLLRVGLFKGATSEYFIVIYTHHIIADGYSYNIILRQLAQFYKNIEPINLKTDYIDYAAWNEHLGQLNNLKSKKQWVSVLNNFEGCTHIPYDHDKPKTIDQLDQGETYHFKLNKEQTEKLKKFATDSDKSVFTLVISFLYILVNKLTAKNDIVIGTPFLGRIHPDLDEQVGLFANVLPMRCEIERDNSFGQLLKKISECINFIFDNQHCSIEELTEWLGYKRQGVNHPYFEVVFAMQNIQNNEIQFSDMKLERFPIHSTTAKYDLILYCDDSNNEIEFAFEYRKHLYHKETIQNLGQFLCSIINQALQNPNIKVGKIDLIDRAAKKEIVSAINNKYKKKPKIHGSVYNSFLNVVNENPDRIALAIKDSQISYGELDRISSILAYELIQRGIKKHEFVGLLMEHSEHTIISILSIIKMGAAYVPLEKNIPEDRLRFVLGDANITMILTDEDSTEKQNSEGNEILNVTKLNYQKSIATNIIEQFDLTGTDPLYVIYTSGTTGTPKGVLIENRNVNELVLNNNDLFKFSKTDNWLLFHSYSFDFSVWEIFAPLLHGGKLVVMDRRHCKDVHYVHGILSKYQVNVFNQTPTSLYNFVDFELHSAVNKLSLRYIILGGEKLNPSNIRSLKHKYPATRIINMYGITETTVHVTFQEVELYHIEQNISSIGRPLQTARCYLLDENGEVAPYNTEGEIYVGGSGLARGYLNNPELTTEKFVTVNITGRSERLYKSGDMARLNSSTELIYKQRKDSQIQHKGYRIELQEIENNIIKHHLVDNAKVVFFQENNASQLIAYYTTNDKVPLNKSEFDKVRSFLPEYMIPSEFIHLNEFPKTENDKLDISALPRSGEIIHSENVVVPRDRFEKSIMEIWNDVLGKKVDDINASFFVNGGDSIKAIKLITKVNKLYNSDMRLEMLYNSDTVLEFSNELKSKTNSNCHFVGTEQDYFKDVRDTYKDDVKDAEDIYSLTAIEQGMIFHSMVGDNDNIYHDRFVYSLKFETFDSNKFKTALQLLVHKHENLRASYILKEPFAKIIHKKLSEAYQYKNLKSLDKRTQEIEIEKYILWEKNTSFTVSIPPLWRLGLFETTDDIRVVWSFHHAILDGWSNALFINELCGVYESLLKTEVVILPTLKFKYKSYVKSESIDKNNSSKRKFWLDKLNGYKKMDFPSTFTTNTEDAGCRSLKVDLDDSFLGKIDTLSKKLKVGPKNIYFSAYVYLVKFLNYQKDILVGLVSNCRPAIEDAEYALGCFLNTIPIRIKVQNNISWRQLIVNISDLLIEAKDYESIPLLEIKGMIKSRDQKATNLFETYFNYVDFHLFNQNNNRQNHKLLHSFNESETPLRFTVSRTKNYSHLIIYYLAQYFKLPDIEKMGQLYKKILSEICVNLDDKIENFKLLRRSELDTIVLNSHKPINNYLRKVKKHVFRREYSKELNAAEIENLIHQSYIVILDENQQLLSTNTEGQVYFVYNSGAPEINKDNDYVDRNILRNNTKRVVLNSGLFGKWRDGALHLSRFELDCSPSDDLGRNGVVSKIFKSGEISGSKYSIVKYIGYDGLDKYLAFFDEKNGVINSLNIKLLQINEGRKIDAFVRTDIVHTKSNRESKLILDTLPGYYNETAKGSEDADTKVKLKIKRIFCDVLNISQETVSFESDFFDLGGNSIKAIVTITEINTAFGFNLKVKGLFRYPTITGFYQNVFRHAKIGAAIIQRCEKKEHYSLSPNQKAIWIQSQLKELSISYNVTASFTINESIDPILLNETLLQLVLRHESLRCRIVKIDDGARQQIQPLKNSMVLERIRYYPDYQGDISDFEAGEIKRQFNLEEGYLFRINVLPQSNSTFFVFCLHHIISDASSRMIILQDFLRLYENNKTKSIKEILPQIHIQYSEYCEWYMKCLANNVFDKQKEYWVNHLKGNIDRLKLPYDFTKSDLTNDSGIVSFKLKQDFINNLKEFRKEGSTMFMVFVALLNILLYHVTGNRRITIGTVISTRDQMHLKNIVGYFLNTIVLSHKIDPYNTFHALMDRVRETCQNAYEHKLYPFQNLINELEIKREVNQHPIFDVLIDYKSYEIDQNDFITKVRFNDRAKNISYTKFDLVLQVLENPDSFLLQFEYDKSKFHESTIKYFIAYFERILEQYNADRNSTICEYVYKEDISSIAINPISR